jgi:hypothetical protein
MYVPVTNFNYLPEGIVRLEGYVPPLNGGNPDDIYLAAHKELLESDPNGLESGPHEDNEWVDPNEPPDEGTPVALEAPDEDEAPADEPKPAAAF